MPAPPPNSFFRFPMPAQICACVSVCVCSCEVRSARRDAAQTNDWRQDYTDMPLVAPNPRPVSVPPARRVTRLRAPGFPTSQSPVSGQCPHLEATGNAATRSRARERHERDPQAMSGLVTPSLEFLITRPVQFRFLTWWLISDPIMDGCSHLN